MIFWEYSLAPKSPFGWTYTDIDLYMDLLKPILRNWYITFDIRPIWNRSEPRVFQKSYKTVFVTRPCTPEMLADQLLAQWLSPGSHPMVVGEAVVTMRGVIRRSGELFNVAKQIYAITPWIQPKPDGSRGKMHPKTAFLGSKTCKNKRIALFEQVLLPNRCFFLLWQKRISRRIYINMQQYHCPAQY